MNIASYGTGSHEFALGLKFCKKEKQEIEELISKEELERITDTVRIVETITDTVFVERAVDTLVVERVTVDTVYLENPDISNEEIEHIMINAEQSLEFEHDKAIIVKNSYGDLEALTNALLIRKDLNITLEGHTDSNGTEDYNMRLSKNRVEAVKKFFVMYGVEESRISISYYGESKPIADNLTSNGRAKNRRVIISVSE